MMHNVPIERMYSSLRHADIHTFRHIHIYIYVDALLVNNMGTLNGGRANTHSCVARLSYS